MKMAKNWLQQMLGSMFQPVSRSDALRIVSQAFLTDALGIRLICHGTKPENCRIYKTPAEPCWYIYAPWPDDNGMVVLRGSRVILVGKLTGIIHYDGSAGDEG